MTMENCPQENYPPFRNLVSEKFLLGILTREVTPREISPPSKKITSSPLKKGKIWSNIFCCCYYYYFTAVTSVNSQALSIYQLQRCVQNHCKYLYMDLAATLVNSFLPLINFNFRCCRVNRFTSKVIRLNFSQVFISKATSRKWGYLGNQKKIQKKFSK